jgi:hypothetical protein
LNGIPFHPHPPIRRFNFVDGKILGKTIEVEKNTKENYFESIEIQEIYRF